MGLGTRLPSQTRLQRGYTARRRQDRGSALSGLRYGSWLVARGSRRVASGVASQVPRVLRDSSHLLGKSRQRCLRAKRGRSGTAPAATADGRTRDRRAGAHGSKVQVSPRMVWEETHPGFYFRRIPARRSSAVSLVGSCAPTARSGGASPSAAGRGELGHGPRPLPEGPGADSTLPSPRQAAQSHVTGAWAV